MNLLCTLCGQQEQQLSELKEHLDEEILHHQHSIKQHEVCEAHLVHNYSRISCHRSDQGPVVQSVVSLTSSLRVISLLVLADSIYNILKFFAEKM